MGMARRAGPGDATPCRLAPFSYWTAGGHGQSRLTRPSEYFRIHSRVLWKENRLPSVFSTGLLFGSLIITG